MKKTNRKGFTIVELVIVIAVIAILAAVLIPTFAGVISKAQKNANLQQARNFYTLLEANTVAGTRSGRYSLVMGKTGLVVSKAADGTNQDAELVLWNALGDDVKGFTGATIAMDCTPLTEAGPFTVTAFYFQAKGNANWVKIDLVNGTLEDVATVSSTMKCTFDGKIG